MGSPSGIRVFTYKEGLLSRLAHDLQFTAHRYEVALHAGTLTVRLDPRALRVDGAVRHGTLAPEVLGEDDLRRIDTTTQDEILETGTHPEVRLHATVHHEGGARFTARGELSLRGRTDAVVASLTLDGMVRGTFELIPSRFGIAPYRALAGALKVQDRVAVAIELPAAAVGLTPENWARADCRWQGPDGGVD